MLFALSTLCSQNWIDLPVEVDKADTKRCIVRTIRIEKNIFVGFVISIWSNGSPDVHYQDPRRVHRHLVSLSTHWRRHEARATHFRRDGFAGIGAGASNAAKFGRRRARVNQFEYYFRCQHENATIRHGSNERRQFTTVSLCILTQVCHRKTCTIFTIHNLSVLGLYASTWNIFMTLNLMLNLVEYLSTK